MRNRSCRPLRFICLLLALAAQTPALGQRRNDDPQPRPPGERPEVASSLSAIEQAIARLEAKMSQLETKVDRLVDQPSGFSSVTVRLVDQEGRSMSGFEVELQSSGDVQQATASGVSNHEGIALTRHLPYGRYRLSINGHGWKTMDLVTVEVGKTLDLVLVAPSPDRLGTLVLQSAFPTTPLEGLRFGSRQLEQVNNTSSWATMIAPEPEGEGDDTEEHIEELPVDVDDAGEGSSDPWQTFPTVSDGIEIVGLVLEFSGDRQTQQGDLGNVRWQWDAESADDEAPRLRWLVRSDGIVQPLLEATEKRTQLSEKSGRFGALAEENSDERRGRSRRKRLGYHMLKLGEEHRGGARLELPAGQIGISIDGIYGRPSEEMLKVIGEAEETAEHGQLWLRAVIQSDSEWLRKILGDTMLHNSRRFRKEVDLSPGESTSFSVGAAE